MKYLLLFVFLSLMLSCSSSKKITETSQSDTTESTETTAPTPENMASSEAETAKENTIENTNSQATTNVDNEEKLEVSDHTLWDTLLQKHVTSKGNVDYKGFRTDRKLLLSYIDVLNDNMPNDDWTKNKVLAYWINAYNAMTVDLILRHYPIKSIKDIKNPWQQRYWKLGDKWYNLDEIEHQILRKMDEPRIHFAIVCASYSCPKLQNRAFVASNLEAQLTKATKEFLSDSERNSISKTQLELSKIFQWFANDFKQEGSLIDFLNQYSEVKISNTAKVRFKDYNWDLNE